MREMPSFYTDFSISPIGTCRKATGLASASPESQLSSSDLELN